MMIPPELAPPGGMPPPPGGGLPPGMPPPGGGGLPPGIDPAALAGGPPMGGPGGDAGGGDPMAALQALLGAGGGAPPGGDAGGGGLADLLGGAAPGGGDDQLGSLLGNAPDDEGKNPPEIGNWSSTDHIRAAIKHLMMAMTNTDDDTEGHGIVKGMAALHGILAGKQKANATVTAAGGTPAGG